MEYQKSFRQLIVWQEAKKLALVVYKITKIFPAEEKFSIILQMRRSACSILANIAEGNSKKHIKDRKNFFNIAQGSLAELECFCEISMELDYIDEENYKNIIELINKTNYLLTKFIKSQI